MRRNLGTRLFLGLLAAVAILYASLVSYHILGPELRATDADLLAQCRLLCQKYGLVPTGNIAADAEAYLAATQTKPLSAGLSEILNDASFQPVPSQQHPLIGKPAPAFALKDSKDVERSFSEWSSRGPVIVVVYYGYGCNHCVAQLFAIDKDLELFHELGAEVVAMSSDSTEHTRDRFKEYGEFHFPVLSDPENKTAASFGVFDGKELDHGTFVVKDGRVVWANTGNEPFLDNKTLLHVLKSSEGKSSGVL
ncbi:peroxiredoxin family protein [Caulifigura coniformis]|uniref:peroxiredoxin family protein n=1 Tax=Caulifigura coniformis TaxID=2527983 RepID=UPI001E46018B|nr:redoxin domain-containing protein [Caulifigura coniformis]